MYFANVSSGSSPASKFLPAICVLLSLGIFLFGASFFATIQSIWVDESTQMSGLALPLDTQLDWMLNQVDLQLGVPPDRMPPLSYWLGTAWASVFGLTEMSMRWFGITAVLLSAPALYMTGRLAGGAAGAIFITAFIFISPSMIVYAVEIRTYPLFFCLSAWAVWAYAQLLYAHDDASSLFIWGVLVLFLAGSSYAHYFGLPLAACLLFSLLVQRLWFRLPLKPLVFASVGFAFFWTGVIPFFLTSLGNGSGTSAPLDYSAGDIIQQMGRLVFRQVFHPVLLAVPTVLIIGGIGTLGLIIGSLSRLKLSRDTPPAQHIPIYFILLPLALAFIGLMALQLLLIIDGKGSIDATVPHYNLWLLPIVATFFACSLRPGKGQRGIMICAAGLVATKLFGTVLFLQNPATYTHGPGEWLAEAIEDPDRTLIIHEAGGVWGSLFFPVNYLTQQRITQWLRQPNGEVAQFSAGPMIPIADPIAEQARFDRIIEVDARNFTSLQLARITSGDVACGFPSPLVSATQANLEAYCSYVSAVRRITDNNPQ